MSEQEIIEGFKLFDLEKVNSENNFLKINNDYNNQKEATYFFINAEHESSNFITKEDSCAQLESSFR